MALQTRKQSTFYGDTPSRLANGAHSMGIPLQTRKRSTFYGDTSSSPEAAQEAAPRGGPQGEPQRLPRRQLRRPVLRRYFAGTSLVLRRNPGASGRPRAAPSGPRWPQAVLCTHVREIRLVQKVRAHELHQDRARRAPREARAKSMDTPPDSETERLLWGCPSRL